MLTLSDTRDARNGNYRISNRWSVGLTPAGCWLPALPLGPQFLPLTTRGATARTLPYRQILVVCKYSRYDPSMRFEPLPDSVLETSVSDRFEQVARIYAGRLAIDDGRLAVTYGELANMARAIAARIEIAMHGRPGPIAILLANETRFPAAILGVLATSRACIPLDCDAPAERNRLIAAHATAAGVISTGRLAVQARSLFADLPVIDIEALIIPDLRAKPPCARPDDVAAILYTSGSAGAPKGVYQNHRGVLHDILEAVNGQHISSEDRLALFYSPTVISGFRIALSALLVGAQLHILSPRDLRGAKLVSELQKRRITIFRSVPALFRHVIEALEQNERLNTVRLVVLGGDRVDWTDFDAFRRSCPPNAQFGVHLGATECWTLYLEWFADEQSRTTNGKLPVGRVIGERTVMLVGEDGHIVADGEVGEFVVLSRHLALGYWRDDELTARAFTTRRLDSEQRIYRTGDLGVRRSDGLFEHVGRKDQQIKLSGRRVELAEVEIALASCRGVRDAAVVARPNESGVPRLLAAYCELEPAVTGLLPHHLRVMLAETLPLFMVPRSITILDALPRLPNFKIDREELRRRDRLEREHSSPPVEPNNKIQETLLKIWRDVLNRHDIGCNDDFFLCGGDSLGAVRVLAEVAEVYRVELTIDVLYGPGGTVAGMAKTIEARVWRHAFG